MATKNTKNTKKHPPHKAREIRCLYGDKFVGWSIYPEQLIALERQFTRSILLHSVDGLRDLQCVKDWARTTARSCMKSIGLVPPSVSSVKSADKISSR